MDLIKVSEKIESRPEIFRRLNDCDIPWRSWGKGTSRDLNAFFAYHEKERLYFRKPGDKLVIDVYCAVVLVYHRFNWKWLEIYEDKQVCDTGKILRRSNYNGIAETMRRGESEEVTAHRCLFQELGFKDQTKYQLSKCLKVEQREPVPSEKWPGIWASYHRHLFQCVISRKIFRRDGYTERDDDRVIHFRWKARDELQLGI